MKTLKDIEAHLGLTPPSVPLDHGYTLHFLEVALPGMDFNLLGDIFYTTSNNQRPEQHFFFLTSRGRLDSKPKVDEALVAYDLTEKVEQLYHDAQLKVVDVALPKNHGFTGTRHNCRQLKQRYTT